jgi:hypothetical protein
MKRDKKKPELCHYCERRQATTKDHIVPKAKGGQNANWNYVPACQPCNNKKADSWPTCTCPVCWMSVALHAEAGITEGARRVRDAVGRYIRREGDQDDLYISLNP